MGHRAQVLGFWEASNGQLSRSHIDDDAVAEAVSPSTEELLMGSRRMKKREGRGLMNKNKRLRMENAGRKNTQKERASRDGK